MASNSLLSLIPESVSKTLISLDSAILQSSQCVTVLDQVFLTNDVQNYTITKSLLRRMAALGIKVTLFRTYYSLLLVFSSNQKNVTFIFSHCLIVRIYSIREVSSE